MPTYRISVGGIAPTTLGAAFPGLDVDETDGPGGGTVLHGDLPDQAALIGVLQYLDMVGAQIRAVQREG